jgi:acyl carrier protein
MSKEDILDRIQNVFRDIFNIDSLNINRETNANHIEDWDSITHIRLVLSIEKEFKLKFSLTELQAFQNVGDIVDLIATKTL